jgi:hypothetical protein
MLTERVVGWKKIVEVVGCVMKKVVQRNENYLRRPDQTGQNISAYCTAPSSVNKMQHFTYDMVVIDTICSFMETRDLLAGPILVNKNWNKAAGQYLDARHFAITSC